MTTKALRPCCTALVIVLTLLVSGITANASTIFIASLTLDQEVVPPPRIPTLSTGGPRPNSFGFGTFELNDLMTELSMDVTVFNIDVTANTPDPPIAPTGSPQTPDANDNLVAAHIHAGATGGPGSNAGVVWGFFGAPDHNTGPDDLMITAFSAASPGPGGHTVGGRFTAVWNLAEGAGGGLAVQLPHILAGRSYVNFHTTQFGGGEIRGQLQAVPEPGTLSLLGLGAAAMARRVRRRMRDLSR
jgi:hypothetical protein